MSNANFGWKDVIFLIVIIVLVYFLTYRATPDFWVATILLVSSFGVFKLLIKSIN